jgi:hypothetical protein
MRLLPAPQSLYHPYGPTIGRRIAADLNSVAASERYHLSCLFVFGDVSRHAPSEAISAAELPRQ